RLLGQVRKPARQHAPNQAEELPVRADPDRSLSDSQRDQLRIADQRPPTAARGTGYSSANTYAATTRASRSVISSSHLEGTDGLEALLREQTAGPCRNPPFHINPLAGS